MRWQNIYAAWVGMKCQWEWLECLEINTRSSHRGKVIQTHTQTHRESHLHVAPRADWFGLIEASPDSLRPHFALRRGPWSTSLLRTVTHKHTEREAPLIAEDNLLQPQTTSGHRQIHTQPLMGATPPAQKFQNKISYDISRKMLPISSRTQNSLQCYEGTELQNRPVCFMVTLCFKSTISYL